ncbi:MAG: hypothetical protein Q8O56_11220 [Solirubrobacteraceae bacterium]|nr:hypothetical protein [Solirubrobacteraceae bacterium]
MRSIISIPAGMAGMPIGLFLALTTIGAGSWNAVLMTTGAALGGRFEEVGDIIGPISTAVVAVLAFAVLGILVWLRRRRLPAA